MRLIDADELVAFLHGIGGCDAPKDSWADGWDTAINETLEHVLLMQTEEAELKKCGKWLWDNNAHDYNLGGLVCSECRITADFPYLDGCNPLNFRGSRYCGNCGARMTDYEID